MKRFLILGGELLLVVLAVWLFFQANSGDKVPEKKLISTVTYQCDNNHTITASYYEGEEITVPAGEPPVPTGSVDVALDGGETATFFQTISASGVRYTDKDESMVFWSKGNEILMLRNDKPDTTYTNCVDSTAETVTEEVSTPQLPYQYISATEWPPLVEAVEGEYMCDSGEEKTFGEDVYCFSMTSEGAAGSTYTTYVYSGESKKVSFTLRFPQCLNYDEPQQGECVAEQEGFDVDALAGELLNPANS